jgi:hypothetical protein
MRSCRLLVCVLLLFVGLFVGTASSTELATADISLALTAHEAGPDVENPGPVFIGEPVIGEEIWFVHDVTNNGPDPARVTLELDATAWPKDFHYAGGYDHWTMPVETTGSFWVGHARDCDDFVMSPAGPTAS